ncbi:MAG: 2OG-Fe(II) oxygenase family protein [Halioglobus sp.]
MIDLERPAADCAEDIAKACREWGFFQVVNFGIAPELMSQVAEVGAAFFAQPASNKRQVSRTQDNPFGFYDRELTKNLRDRKEIFDYSPVEDTPWPATPNEFRSVLEQYAQACHSLALRLLELCCMGLTGQSDALSPYFSTEHSGFLRLNYYPHERDLAADLPGAGPFGISEHTDAGALTLLMQDEVPGLQVLQADGWKDVDPLPGALTVNIGDMMQVWSNDQYQAPLHRVRASGGRSRSSAAYFFNPAYATVAEPLAALLGPEQPANYSPVPWEEFRRLRAQGDYGDYGKEVQISDYQI